MNLSAAAISTGAWNRWFQPPSAASLKLSPPAIEVCSDAAPWVRGCSRIIFLIYRYNRYGQLMEHHDRRDEERIERRRPDPRRPRSRLSRSHYRPAPNAGALIDPVSLTNLIAGNCFWRQAPEKANGTGGGAKEVVCGLIGIVGLYWTAERIMG